MQIDDIFFVFPENRFWHVMQIVEETIFMKCQTLFSEKKKIENISKCRLLKFFPTMFCVNMLSSTSSWVYLNEV